MALREITVQDLELILKWRNNPAIRQSMFSREIISLQSHKAWFNSESLRNNSCWLMYLNAEGIPSGVIYCTNIDYKNSNGFWGFYAAPDSPRGTGTLMCTEGLTYFFNIFKLHKINADVIEDNKRSNAFHKKMGFAVEGVFKEHVMIGGRYQAITRFAMFASDWFDKLELKFARSN